MPKQHWMISLVRIIALLFVLFGCLMVFWYTPFYSNFVVKLLHASVPIKVDEVAAKSQQLAALTDKDDVEPGSEFWFARQAYLKLIEQHLGDEGTDKLAEIQARYVVLKARIQQEIIEEELKQERKAQEKLSKIPVLLSDQVESSAASESEDDEQRLSLFNRKNLDHQSLMEKYEFFLANHPIDADAEKLDPQIYKDIALIQDQNKELYRDNEKPYAIVVLGGGLTLAKNKIDIVVNDYTRSRLEKTIEIEKQTDLPIVLSGVEAPYMQTWLSARGVEANLLENRSMNTCENTRFSSLLLQKKGGAPTVILITDRYHMTRTRRLFALNGIKTIPVEAPMPTSMTPWQPSQLNYDHSRRANYELLATIRDVLFGSSGCREVP